jgi:DNA primase
LSPFQAERTPSFFVNDQKGFFHDFSSGKHGDAFAFVMETEGISFPEAVERLAGIAGLQMPENSEEAKQDEKQRASLIEVMELACTYFESKIDAKAAAYLDGRSIDEALRKTFRLGYAPAERYGLRDHLAGKGIERDQMIEAGLLVHGEEIAVPYDRFRDRIMFPICDRSGRVIAFSGRAMAPDAPAKYLNSPETPLYSKSRCLYNHHLARQAAHKSGRLIVVEGNVDVIAMTRCGFAAVAPMGTALTEEQIELLWKMAPEPILCFDGDKAGRKAADRAIATALPLIGTGRGVRFAILPEGQDPDDLLKQGPEAFNKIEPQSLIDALWQRELALHSDTPDGKVAFERALFEAVEVMRDHKLRSFYRRDIRQRLNRLFGIRQAPRTDLHIKQSDERRHALILAILLKHPELIDAEVERLAELEIEDRRLQALRDAMISWAADGTELAEHAEAKAKIRELVRDTEIGRDPAMTLAHALDRERLKGMNADLEQARLDVQNGVPGSIERLAIIQSEINALNRTPAEPEQASALDALIESSRAMARAKSEKRRSHAASN